MACIAAERVSRSASGIHPGQPVLERLHPRAKAAALAEPVDHRADLRRGEGLREVVARAAAHRLHRGVDRGVGGDDHHVELGVLGEERGNAGPGRCRFPASGRRRRRSTGPEASAASAASAEPASRTSHPACSRQTRDHRADVPLVVDHQDPVGRRAGGGVLGRRVHRASEVTPVRGPAPSRWRGLPAAQGPAGRVVGPAAGTGRGLRRAGAETETRALAWSAGSPERVRARSVVVPGARPRSRPRAPGRVGDAEDGGAVRGPHARRRPGAAWPPPERVAVAVAFAGGADLQCSAGAVTESRVSVSEMIGAARPRSGRRSVRRPSAIPREAW